MGNTTIYEIAQAAGVSASTVSRVVNNKPGVKKATKKRVLDQLEKMHYTPNETARGLVTQSSGMIGILLTDIRTSHHTDGIYCLQRELDDQGYFCIIMNTGHSDEEKVRYIQILSQRRVEAAVLIGSAFQRDAVKQAISTYLPNVPVIIANGYLDLPNVYGLIADERNGIMACVRLLAGKGKCSLAFLRDYVTPSNELKIEGFSEGIRNYCGNDAPRIIDCGEDYASIYHCIQKLMTEHPDLNGLICAEDSIAATALRALSDMHIAVPAQVSVIGVNNSSVARIVSPTLTSLDNMLQDLCVTAAHTVSAILRGQHVVKKMMVYSHIEEREST